MPAARKLTYAEIHQGTPRMRTTPVDGQNSFKSIHSRGTTFQEYEEFMEHIYPASPSDATDYSPSSPSRFEEYSSNPPHFISRLYSFSPPSPSYAPPSPSNNIIEESEFETFEWPIEEIIEHVSCDECDLDVVKVRYARSLLRLDAFVKHFQFEMIRKNIPVWKSFQLVDAHTVSVEWNEDFLPTEDAADDVPFGGAQKKLPSYKVFEKTSNPHTCCGPQRQVYICYPFNK